MIDIEDFGVYKEGMTREEIKNYLKEYYHSVTQKISFKLIDKKFDKIAGVNTCASIKCPCCKKQIILMYRHDVKRFADKLFLGRETYFD